MRTEEYWVNNLYWILGLAADSLGVAAARRRGSRVRALSWSAVHNRVTFTTTVQYVGSEDD